MSFSILIPVYNEERVLEENVDKLVKYLKNLKEEYEILICSNGSTDNTNKIGKQLENKYERLKFFTIPQKGVGGAFKINAKHAKYEKLVSLDMDLSIDLNFINKVRKLLDEYDVVVGSKKMGRQKRSLIRKIISDGYIKLVKLLLGLNYRDYSIAAKAYHKSKIKKYLDNVDYGSSYVMEIIYHIKNNNNKIKEVPVLCEDKRKSKFNIFHEIFYRFKNLISFWIKMQFQ